MNTINIKKIGYIGLITYIFLAISFYLIAGEDLHRKMEYIDVNNTKSEKPLYDLSDDKVLEERFIVEGNNLNNIDIRMDIISNSEDINQSILVQVRQENNNIYEQTLKIEELRGKEYLNIPLPIQELDMQGKEVSILLRGQNLKDTIVIWGNEDKSSNIQVFIDGKIQGGSMSINTLQVKELWLGKNYWIVFSIGLIGLILFIYMLFKKQKENKKSATLDILEEMLKYKFLLKQLVKRDFNKKYKRSALGILWSFLNPLLTMLVQLVVFSTIFKRDTVNYPVYLMVGTILFSFLTECSNMGLTSIVGNSNLITKVYVPKYIYPISRAISSAINVCLAMIPLFIVIIISGVPLNEKMLLLPFVLITLFIFALGVALMLATGMVFFRDIEFLWRIGTMLWMYLTPLFYTASRMPEYMQGIFKINPMYHYITFARSLILDGVSPEPMAYIWCVVFSIISLSLGIYVFNKHQDEFILNI